MIFNLNLIDHSMHDLFEKLNKYLHSTDSVYEFHLEYLLYILAHFYFGCIINGVDGRNFYQCHFFNKKKLSQ